MFPKRDNVIRIFLVASRQGDDKDNMMNVTVFILLTVLLGKDG